MVQAMLAESCRVLKVGGTFVMVSAQGSVQQQVHDEALQWKAGQMKIPTALYNKNHALGCDEITFILCRKKKPVSMTDKDARFWAMVVARCEAKKKARALEEAQEDEQADKQGEAPVEV
eukprot:TRINITY_DN36264_c0_g1_i1.p1 TRINITY_DN36264_c0_g1~~TRINITY_DN36264_c0_g1_i1.p1  ORF type:complete len:119 (+),score=50.08 TRINITY_DN36264_c0_g1_i1:3-359(+)